MHFGQLIGHAGVIGKLKQSIISDDFGHAYIFYGLKGVGKRTAASIFAHAILCSDRAKSGEACGRCASCRLFAAGTNPDFNMVRPENGVIKVEEIRKIQSEIIINPMYSAKKVYVIEDADRMNIQAQNCLLKTFEEPPDYSVIILTLENLTQMLETIRSRAVNCYFARNSFEEVRDYLTANVKGVKNVDFVSRYAGGSIGRALQLCADEDFMRLRDGAAGLAAKMSGLKKADTFDGMEFIEKNRDNISDILEIMTLIYRDALIYAGSREEKLLINADKKGIILNIAGKTAPEKLMNSIDALEKAGFALKKNASFASTIEVMLMRVRKELNDD